MVYQSCPYLKLKVWTYYFSRRVPKRLQKQFKNDRVEACLHTILVSSAPQQAQVLACELKEHWYILRPTGREPRASALSDNRACTFVLPIVLPELSWN